MKQATKLGSTSNTSYTRLAAGVGCLLALLWAAQPAAAQIPLGMGVGVTQPVAVPVPAGGQKVEAAAAPVEHNRVGMGTTMSVASSLAAAGAAKPAQGAEAGTGKSGHEGVTVHGHWIIDLKNPDGTLAEHREFENALAQDGGGLLVGLLSGQIVPGNFAVTLYSSGTGPCGQYCYLVPSLTTQPGASYCSGVQPSCAGTLTMTPSYGTGFNGPFTLTLAGTITASQAGTINFVDSGLTTCPSVGTGTNPPGAATVLPSACAASTTTSGQYPYLTGTTLGTVMNVANGQLIQVQVIISFS